MRRSSAVVHQLTEIKEYVEKKEETIPQTDCCIQIVECNLETDRDTVNYLCVKTERGCCANDDHWLTREEGKEKASNGLPE